MPKSTRIMPETSGIVNWRQPEHIRWALQNFGFLPNLAIARGRTEFEIGQGPQHDVEAHTFDHEGRTLNMTTAMGEDDVDGYLVIKDGKLIYENYFGAFQDSDHHLWASATKSLISTAFGILVEKFQVDETKSPVEYIPALARSAFDGVTIRQILNMVTALNYTEEYDEMTPGSVHFEYFRRLGFLADFELMAIDPLHSDASRGVRDMLPVFERDAAGTPGTVFQYQSPNVDVIGWLIEQVSGQPLKDFIRENIWAPLGTEHDAIFSTDVALAPIATGGLNTTLRDAARFGLAALGDGKLGNNQIFPADWIKDTYALTGEDKAAAAASVFCEKDSPRFLPGFTGYRSFWWNFDASQGERMAMGVHGQVIYVNKAKNLVIANFASPPLTSNVLRPSFKQMLAGTRSLAAVL